MQLSQIIDSDYQELLQAFIDRGYEFSFFSEVQNPKRQLILRHDIDFDCELAYKMALKEQLLEVKSTYFFLISSESYNLLTEKNSDYVRKIKEMGHQISLHFDPAIYSDFRQGLTKEVELFEQYFNEKIEVISLHRPNSFFLDYDQTISGIKHTYQNAYFKDIKYISDSTGIWRYGNPLASNEFKDLDSIHLLIHPIWWETVGETNSLKIKNQFFKKYQETKEHYKLNCKPFLDVLDEV